MTVHRLTARLHPARGREDGFAMILVVGVCFALTIVALAGLGFATNGLTSARHEQDYVTAEAAAQAGLQDFESHLNVCDTYWDSTSGCYAASPANAALVTSNPTAASWSSAPTVPGTAGTSPGRYVYRLVAGPLDATSRGTIRLEVWGHSKNVTRSLVADLQKTSFLNYIYYTDYEAQDPGSVPASYPAYTQTGCYTDSSGHTYNCQFVGISASTAQTACGHHYYDDGTGPRTTMTETVHLVPQTSGQGTAFDYYLRYGCDISFAGGDVIKGPLHTNDAILIGGAARFTSPQTETSWADGATPAPTPGARYRAGGGCSGGCAPDTTTDSSGVTGQLPEYSGLLQLPPSNTSIRAQTAAPAAGCLFTGPTRILLKSNGTMDVTSPSTRATGSQCGTGFTSGGVVNVAVPSNGVVYVQNLPSSSSDPNYNASPRCSAPWAGSYPMSNELLTTGASGVPAYYGCRNGDAFVEGTLKGQLTIATENGIEVTGDTKYVGGTTGTDVLGLIANNYVQAYHPVQCSNYPAAPSSCYNLTPPGKSGPLTSLEIDAAILSVAHSFRVASWGLGAPLSDGSTTNKLHVVGAIAQKYRGAVATSNGTSGVATGYLKDYSYDPRLRRLPPPYFLDPTQSPWQPASVSEQ